MSRFVPIGTKDRQNSGEVRIKIFPDPRWKRFCQRLNHGLEFVKPTQKSTFTEDGREGRLVGLMRL